MAFYEHVLITRQDISPQQAEALNEEMKTLLEGLGGHIAKIEYWGLRNLQYRIKKNRKGHYSLLAIDAPADAAAACEAHDLDEMLGNLIDNACKWARRRVSVKAQPRGRWIEVTIADDGPGLTPEQAAAALQRGRRLDEAAAGYGFGLPIASELAELYGGALTLAPAEAGGLLARLKLPAAAG